MADLPVVPNCTITPEQARAQALRRERLAPAITGLQADATRVRVRFRQPLDRDALDGLIAVERQCCPFLEFAFDEGSLQLEVSVQSEEHEPALAAIAALVGATEPHTPA